VYIQGPTVCSDKPWNRNATAVSSKPVPTLTAAHLVSYAPAVKLWSSFSKPQDGRISNPERYACCFWINRDLLNRSLPIEDFEVQWICPNFNRKVEELKAVRFTLCELFLWPCPIKLNQGIICGRDGVWFSFYGREVNSKCVCTYCRDR